MTPVLTKSFRASAAVDPFLIVAASGDKTVARAAASTDLLIGTSGSLGVDSGSMADIVLDGVDEVRCGGNVSFGDPLTSDANGKAVEAVPVADAIVRVIGFALADGANNDVIPYRVAPSLIATPAEPA